MTTLSFEGTGGIWEGSAGAADVNVNMDVPYEATHTGFSADPKTAQTITIPHDNDLDGGSAYTFMAWVRSSATTAATGEGGVGNSSFSTIAQLNDSWKLGLHDSGKPFFIYYGSSTLNTNAWTGSTTLVGAGWQHVCVTVGSNTATLYQNGVANSTTKTTAGNASDQGGNILIHSKADDDEILYGNVMDVKLYNATLTADEVKIAASKINIDSTLISSTAPQIWAKLNTGATGSVASAIGGTATVGTGMDDAIPYDAFSVNAQDTTTTDGTFTVTQGKLECLSQTSVHMSSSGSDDHIELASTITQDIANGATYSCWWKPNHITSYHTFFGAGGSKYFDYGHDTNTKYGASIPGGGTAKSDVIADYAINTWFHGVVVFETTGITFYHNGVAVGGTTGASYSGSTLNGPLEVLGVEDASAPNYGMDGNLRECKFFDYALSADQVASLYGGTYNVTPFHQWLLNDSIQGTATTTAVDTGTATAVNGTLEEFAATSGHLTNVGDWNNKTLDLDSTLTIAANGTLSAPRGNLDCAGNLTVTSGGTYTHNNGTFQANHASSNNVITVGGSNATFYNLTNNSSGGQNQLASDLTVENTLTQSGGGQDFKMMCSGGVRTLTMGTSTSAGTITGGASSSNIRFDTNTTNAGRIHGASSLYPCVIGTGDVDWDSGGSGSKVEIQNIDDQVAVVTGGSGVTV